MMPPRPQFNMNAPEGSEHGAQAPSAAYSFQTNRSPIPWAEIFSRHEAVLNTHLDLLGSVKGHVAPDGEAFRTVSSMVNKTIQAMNQCKIVRKHMLNTSDNASHVASATNARSASNQRSTDTGTSTRKKRSRTEKDEDVTSMKHEVNTQSDSTEDVRASKRKRDTACYSGVDEDQHNASGTTETEDISEEVQRRLRIKEERRRRKESARPEKRKRESLLSNESASPGTSKRKKKRAKTEDSRKVEMTSETEAERRAEKLNKSRA